MTRMTSCLLFSVHYKIKGFLCKIWMFFHPATIQFICLVSIGIVVVSMHVFRVQTSNGLYALAIGVIGSLFVAIIVEMGNNRRLNKRRLFLLRNYYKMLSKYEIEKERWSVQFISVNGLRILEDMSDKCLGRDICLWQEGLDIVDERKMINTQTDCVEIFAIAHSIDSIMKELVKVVLERYWDILYEKEYFFLEHILIFFRRLENHARKSLKEDIGEDGNGPSDEEVEDMVTHMISIFLVIPGIVSSEKRAKTIVILKDLDIALTGLLKMLHREPVYGVWTDQQLLNVLYSEEKLWQDSK